MILSLDHPFVRPTDCQHPTITDEQLAAQQTLIIRTAGDAGALHCPDCDEYLYPHDNGEDIIVYAGEPYGAGL